MLMFSLVMLLLLGLPCLCIAGILAGWLLNKYF